MLTFCNCCDRMSMVDGECVLCGHYVEFELGWDDIRLEDIIFISCEN